MLDTYDVWIRVQLISSEHSIILTTDSKPHPAFIKACNFLEEHMSRVNCLSEMSLTKGTTLVGFAIDDDYDDEILSAFKREHMCNYVNHTLLASEATEEIISKLTSTI